MRIIKYKVPYEKMISRLPGFFAYIEDDGFGNMELHKATDSQQGCYGKIVENITLPNDIWVKEIKNDGTKEEDILCAGKSYSYRTLIDTYYKYKTNENSFTYVNKNTKNIYVTVSERLENIEIGKTFDDFDKKGKWILLSKEQVDFHKEYPNKTVKEVLQTTEKVTIYTKVNGDGETIKIKKNGFDSFIEEGIGRIRISEELIAKNPGIPEYIYLSTIKEVYTQLKLLKEKYTKLESLNDTTVNDEICCLKERFEQLGGDDFLEYINNNGLISKAEEIANKYLGYVSVTDKDKLHLNFNVNLTTSNKDLGILTPYIEEYISGKRYYNDDTIARLVNGEWKTYTVKNAEGGVVGEWNSDYKQIGFLGSEYVEEHTTTNSNDTIEIDGTCESHLKSLRRVQEYTNMFSETEVPSVNEDWLFYYRKGMVVNTEFLQDELGNILPNGECPKQKDQNTYINNLYLYGDIINNIDVVEEDGFNYLEIEYYINAHLSAKFIDEKTNEDWKQLYHYADFKLDITSEMGEYNGVKYIDRYIIPEGSELYELYTQGEDCNGETFFNNYINGLYDINNPYNIINDERTDNGLKHYVQSLPHKKMAFSTLNSTLVYNMQIDNETTEVRYIVSSFNMKVKKEKPFQKVNLFRNDYYQSISYRPTVDADVFIDRGVTAAFEKHLKFSEVHTMEDMENYSNGSFFRLEKS